MTNGQIWRAAKCQRQAAIESQRKLVPPPYFYILGGAQRWGCWAVVPPAGSSVQPPRALWTEEELQWTELLRCGRSCSGSRCQLNPCEKGEVQEKKVASWPSGGRKEGKGEGVEDTAGGGDQLKGGGGDKLFQVSSAQCQDMNPLKCQCQCLKCHLENGEIYLESRKNSSEKFFLLLADHHQL